MLSAEAKFLKKLFPEKRYIFCIRHPYDVVLSCFKQAFGRNVAMDNFLTFEDSCRAYDFAMNQWFSTFDFESPEVCYLRYDRLGSRFQERGEPRSRFPRRPGNGTTTSSISPSAPTSAR